MSPDPLLVQPITRSDPRGNLSVLTGLADLPFQFARLFWIHGVAAGTTRGAHAHRVQHQAIICMSGAIDVLVDDGHAPRTVRLDRCDMVLHLPPLVWAEQTVLVEGTVYAVLASGPYEPAEYLLDRHAWVNHHRHGRTP